MRSAVEVKAAEVKATEVKAELHTEVLASVTVAEAEVVIMESMGLNGSVVMITSCTIGRQSVQQGGGKRQGG